VKRLVLLEGGRELHWRELHLVMRETVSERGRDPLSIYVSEIGWEGGAMEGVSCQLDQVCRFEGGGSSMSL
jgi:hypothetical protein